METNSSGHRSHLSVSAILRESGFVCAILLLALGTALPALAALGMLAAILAGLIACEALRYADVRDRVRHQLVHES